MTKRFKFATIPLGWTIKSYFIEVHYLQQSSTVTVQGKCYCFLFFCLSLVTTFSFGFFLGFLFFVVRVLAGWRGQKRCYDTDRTFVTSCIFK